MSDPVRTRTERLWKAMATPPALVILSVAYTAAVTVGASQAIDPNHPVGGRVEDTLATASGLALLSGGIVALVALGAGWWKMERLGIYAVTLGLALRIIVTGGFLSSTPYEVATRAGLIIIAGCTGALRVAVIWGLDLDPNRGDRS